MNQPSVSRNVHFVHSDRHYAAIVTQVHTPTLVDLVVFALQGMAAQQKTSVSFDSNFSQGSWHWPERIDTQ